MPRVGDTMQLLSGTLAVPNTTVQSAPYNAQQQDWVLDANNARPISAGGTGATTATAARVALGAIGGGDLAAAETKTPLVDTDSMVIIDSEDLVSTTKTKRWLVSDFRASLATVTNLPFNLVSTSGANTEGPILTIDRQSPTPANNDYIGMIQFLGRNSAINETITYADISVQITDSINSQEKGNLTIRQMINGVITPTLTLHQTGLTVAGTIAATTGSFSNTIAGVSTIQVTSPSYAVQNIHFWFKGPANEDRGVIYTSGDTAGPITLRTSSTAAFTFGNDGHFTTPSGGFLSNTAAFLCANSNYVYLRPYGIGSAANEAYLRTDGYFFAPVFYGTSALITAGNVGGANVILNGAGEVRTAAVPTTGVDAYSLTVGSISGPGGCLSTSTAAASTMQYHHYIINGNGGIGRITSQGSTTLFTSLSDENYKERIESYSQLEAVRILRADPVVEWDWKNKAKDGSDVRSVGWVAQRSYAVHPDLASPPAPQAKGKATLQSGDDPWMMDYGRRTPYLWAALTWALDQIDDLKADVANLKGTPA